MSSSEPNHPSGVSPDDVRGVISTDLENGVIHTKISDAEFRSKRVNDHEEMGTEHVKQLIKHYAAFLIRTTLDRDVQSGKRKSVSLDYDGSALDELRRDVRDLDPSGELIEQTGVVRRTSDHVGSARPHSRDGIGDRGSRRERR